MNLRRMFFMILMFSALAVLCSFDKTSTETPANPADIKPPAAAAAAGYTKLAFYDDFESISTIDMDATGCPQRGGCPDRDNMGFKWFRAGRPFNGSATPKEWISVKDGVLHLDQPAGANNALMTTYLKEGGGYGGFVVKDEGAYFEASVSFPVPPAEWYAEKQKGAWRKGGWPAFWTMDACHLYGNCTPYMELDFMEYLSYWFAGKDTYCHALHRWIDLRTMNIPCGGPNQPKCHQKEQSNVYSPADTGYLGAHGIRQNTWVKVPDNTDWSGRFNTFGSLLKKGDGIYAYFNDELVSSNTYAEYPWLSIADNGEFPVILGSGNWPFRIDWVRVWVKP